MPPTTSYPSKDGVGRDKATRWLGRDTAGENNDPEVAEDVFTIPPALLGGVEPSPLLLPTRQPIRRIVLEFDPEDGITQVNEEDKSMSRQLIVGCVDTKDS